MDGQSAQGCPRDGPVLFVNDSIGATPDHVRFDLSNFNVTRLPESGH